MNHDPCRFFAGMHRPMLLMLLLGSLTDLSRSLETRSVRGSNITVRGSTGKQPVDKTNIDPQPLVDETQEDHPAPVDEATEEPPSTVVETAQEDPPSFAILLTMYNSPQREGLYAPRLRWWLEKTSLPIFVVDSANHYFPKDMQDIRPFQELHFDQRHFLPPSWNETMDGASTVAELVSLDHAWSVFGKLWSEKYDYVIKVTAKYVLPDLETAMHLTHRGREFIFQDNAFSLNDEIPWLASWVGTECIGFNSRHMGSLLHLLQNQKGYLEKRVAAVAKFGNYTYEHLPPLQIPDEFMTPRGSGDVLWSVLQTSA